MGNREPPLPPVRQFDPTPLLRSIELLNDASSVSPVAGKTVKGDATGKIASGWLPAIPGRLTSFQLLTAGTTYTPTAGTTSILVEVYGAGGGGGGVPKTAAQSAAAGGGASGGYARRWYSTIGASYTYAIGAGGAGGAAGNNPGATGSATSFDAVSVPGGLGGNSMATTAGSAVSRGGSPGAVPTGGDINADGAPGHPGLVVVGSTGVAFSGTGGSSPFGGGGPGANVERAGSNAAASSGGGSGGMCTGTTARAGGNGGPGIILVWEFAS